MYSCSKKKFCIFYEEKIKEQKMVKRVVSVKVKSKGNKEEAAKH
jgi:hypothetical protein